MRDSHPGVRPNTVHYSSLISACATVGRCDEAMQVVLGVSSFGTEPVDTSHGVISVLGRCAMHGLAQFQLLSGLF